MLSQAEQCPSVAGSAVSYLAIYFECFCVSCYYHLPTQAEQDPSVAGSVLNVMELASGFTMADAAAMERVMVYGHTLDAYHALATLDRAGTYTHTQKKTCLLCLPPSPSCARTSYKK